MAAGSPEEEPQKIEVYYIVGDAVEQEYPVDDYPIKVPAEPGVYNFFAELTWVSGDKETVFFRVTVKAGREAQEEPVAEDLDINYHDYEILANYIAKTLFDYDSEIIGGDLKKLGEPYEVQGKYDLNSDGEADAIQVFFSALSTASSIDRASKIRVNDTETEAFYHNPRGVYIIDFNEEDRFRELVVFDDGPSGDPGIYLYRYNGKEVIELGRISGVIGDRPEESLDTISEEDLMVGAPRYTGPYYGAIKIDRRGRILSPNDVVEFLSPEIILGIREIKDEGIEHKKINYSKMLNKEYEIKEDFRTYFEETEKGLKDLNLSNMGWEEENIISFHQGEKIYLKDLDEYGARYVIELQNGKRGIMYFWIGD